MESFESLVNRLNSDSHHLQLEGLTNIAKLLAIVEIFRTPQERRGVAEVCTHLNPFTQNLNLFFFCRSLSRFLRWLFRPLLLLV